MFVILINISNVFQTSFPRFQDVWLANFNNQLATCYEPVTQEVVVPPGADQQLLHGDVLASLPGMGVGDAAFAVQDIAVVQHVGSMLVTEPDMSNPLLGVRGSDAAFLVQLGVVHLLRDEMSSYKGSTILI